MKDIPSSIYHLLLNKEFTLKKATQLIPYLHALGIEGICLSPLFSSFEYSYHITNPNALNPDIGTEKDLKEFCSQLKHFGMKHILDIVPNHMGIKGDKNIWWVDVLENGSKSAYAPFFDIDWNLENKKLRNKIILPILGEPLKNLLEKGELQLLWNNGFWFRYGDYLLPVSTTVYPFLLSQEPVLKKYCFRNKKQWVKLYNKKPSLQKAIDSLLSCLNNHAKLLNKILCKQHYILTHWLSRVPKRNYRRFFNINELIAIHIENKKVFEAHHRYVLELIRRGYIQGLRIDHLDGLYDPSEYLQRIRRKKPGLIFIEKILMHEEFLPEKWPIAGTVGYDFLNILNGLFVDQKNKQKLSEIYAEFIQERFSYQKIYYRKRKEYLQTQMTSEIHALSSLLNKQWPHFSLADIKRAWLEILACFSVYRTYFKTGAVVRKKDREYLKMAIQKAKAKAPKIPSTLFDAIQKYLLSPFPKKDQMHLLLSFQQMTASVMAKGIEDSAFFVYNRLISLNEVGNDPSHFGSSKEEFHSFNLKKFKSWPLGLLTSSTHDSKYSEDVRLRIHAISDMPEKWKSLIFQLRKDNEKYFSHLNGKIIPDPNTEYYIYQMLAAVGSEHPERLWVSLRKAIREAATFTSWRKIDENYEAAVKKFLFSLLNNPSKIFLSFQREIARLGHCNALASLVL